MSRRWWVRGFLAGLAWVAAESAGAQEHLFQGAYLRPAGEFAEYSGDGWGLGYSYVHALHARRALGLRLTAGTFTFATVGEEVCLFSATAGCPSPQMVESTRVSVFATIGPRVRLSLGPLEPFVDVSVGPSLWTTRSRGLSLLDASEFESLGFDWTGGVGIGYVLFDDHAGRLGVVVEGRFHGGTPVRYGPRGELERDGLGYTRFSPSPGPRDLFLLQVGVGMSF